MSLKVSEKQDPEKSRGCAQGNLFKSSILLKNQKLADRGRSDNTSTTIFEMKNKKNYSLTILYSRFI